MLRQSRTGKGRPMIRSLHRKPDGSIQTDLDQAAFGPALKDPQGLLWVDFSAEGPEVCKPILRDTFGFHPLAVDDALLRAHAPEVDDRHEDVQYDGSAGTLRRFEEHPPLLAVDRYGDLAGAGEILVSRTVRDLAVGSRLKFDDHGVHTLRGVPDSWQLFTVH